MYVNDAYWTKIGGRLTILVSKGIIIKILEREYEKG